MSGERAARGSANGPGQATSSAQEQLIVWRRRALDQQLPAAAFPAGSSAPSLVYLWATMLVAVVAVLGFAINDQRGVPPAVLDSQQAVTSKVATILNLSRRSTVNALDQIVATVQTPNPPPPTELLARVVGEETPWTGAAIVETPTRRSLAAKGTALPYDLLPPELPADTTVAITTPDGPALVRIATLDDTRTLLALQPLTMRSLRLNPDARQGIFIITQDGKSTLMQGVSAIDASHLPRAFDGIAGAGSRQSRSIVVTEWSDQQLVVTSAPVGDTGATVASMIVVEVTEGTSMAKGFLLGLSLLAIAIPSFLLMRVSLVRPVRTLLKQAKADACGAVTTNRQPLRVAEADRIARALAVSTRSTLPGKKWQPSALHGLILAAVIALLWPTMAVATTLGFSTPSVPTQLLRDEESQAETASNALGSALDGGLQTVAQISRSAAATPPSQLAPVLRQRLAEESRFRGLYLVDPSGSVVSSAGRESLRAPEPLPGEYGIQLDRSIERLPVVYAYRVGGNGYTVVGEFDIDYLLRMMRQVDGRARVIDLELRTVLDSEGFRVYQTVQEQRVREVAIATLPGGTVGRSEDPDGSPVLLAASGLNEPGSVAHLEWVVVVERNVAALRLPEIVERRWTLLIAGAAVGVILITQIWQFYIFIRPLRRLAAVADKISAGSFDEPIPPQRHDDIGAVAMCLEICRQVRHTGSARFGGAIRMRGPGQDFTTVLPRIRRSTADRAARS